MDVTQQGWMLVAISRPISVDAPTKQLLDGFQILELQVGQFTCWLKGVDRNEYEGELGERNLQDLSWLAPRAVEHDSALNILASKLTVFPLRFGTLFSSPAAVSNWLNSVVPSMDDYFSRCEQKREWHVKVWIDMDQYRQIQANSQARIDSADPNAGTGYLKARQRQREAAARDRVEQQQIVGWIREQLIALAAELCERTIPMQQREDSDRPLVLSLAVLADDQEASDLKSAIETLGTMLHSRWAADVRMQGPFAPLSFTKAYSDAVGSDRVANGNAVVATSERAAG